MKRHLRQLQAQIRPPTRARPESPETKSSDSQGGGNALGQTSASSRHASDETVSAVVVQPMLSPAFPWSAGIKDFTPDTLITGAALSDEAASLPTAGVNSTPDKGESRSPEIESSDSQGRGNALGQTSASSRHASDETVPAAVVQPVLSRAFPWSAGIKDFTPDTLITGAALSDEAASSPTAGVNSTPDKGESRSPEIESSDSQGRGNTLGQISPSIPDSQSEAVPLVVDSSTAAPVLDWKIAMKDLTPDGLVTGADLNVSRTSSSASGLGSPAMPNAIDRSTLPQAPVQGVAPAEPQGGRRLQESATLAAPATGQAGAVANLIAGLSGAPASDARTQSGSGPNPLRDVLHGRGETTDDDSRTPAAKSESCQFVVPFNIALPTLSPAITTPGNVDSGNSQGTPVKPALAQSRTSVMQVSGTQETGGTTGKSVEAAGGAKAEPRKDGSTSSANSQTTDQGNGSVPAKGIEAPPSFSVAGSQPASTTSDGKNASVSSSGKTSDQPTGQFDPESTGVAQGQTQDTQSAYPTSLINSAKLVERIGEAELRLGIRAGEFGSVDIRTSMVRNQFTAEISVEHGELGRVMAAELPSLQNRLTEQRVPVANITVQNHTGSHSTASEQQRPRDGQQMYTTNSVSRQDEASDARVGCLGRHRAGVAT